MSDLLAALQAARPAVAKLAEFEALRALARPTEERWRASLVLIDRAIAEKTLGHHILEHGQSLYVRVHGTDRIRVTAIFTDDEAANTYMAEHSGEGVIAVFGPFILLANVKERKS
jgi:hypothetical protein